MKTATANTSNTSASKKKKGATKKEKKAAVDRILGEERAKKQKLDGVEPFNTKAKKSPNLAERTALARHLGITPQTLYNREFAFVNALPEYAKGMKLLPRRGGSLKEFPNLTPFQQWCHKQFEFQIKRNLNPRDCTNNVILIEQNESLFKVDLFDKEQQLEAAIVPVESETIETREIVNS